MRAAAFACLTLLTACAPGVQRTAENDTLGAPQPRQCFFPQQVTNFRQGETQTIYLKVLGGDVYRLSSGGCLDLDFTNALAIQSEFGATDRICTGDSVRLYVRGTSVSTETCRARIDRVLTDAEVQALPSRQRP